MTLVVSGGTASTTRTAGPAHSAVPPRPPSRCPAWPIVALLAGYPLWWALGLGVLIFPIAAAPMLVLLLRRRAGGRPVRLPPGFAWWALFLVAVVVSIGALGADPAGTVAGHVGDRLIAVAYRLTMYVALTVLLVYAGNLTEAELPRRRLVKLLGWLFVVTVPAGCSACSPGRFEFTSPVECCCRPASATRVSCSRWCTRTPRRSWTWSAATSPARPRRGATPTPGATTSACWSAGWWSRPGRRGRLAPKVFARALPGRLDRAAVCLAQPRPVDRPRRSLVVYVACGTCCSAGSGSSRAVAVAGAALARRAGRHPARRRGVARLDNGKSNGVRSFLIERAAGRRRATPR